MKSIVFGNYEVFEDGSIFSFHTNTYLQPRIKGKRKEVRLMIDGKRKNYIVTRLVYWLFNQDTFDINDTNLCVVCKNPLHFTLKDLKVVHRKDLIHGENHVHACKLTDSQAEEIKALYNGKPCINQHDKAGVSYHDLASRYGVSKGLIAQIVKGTCRDESKYILK